MPRSPHAPKMEVLKRALLMGVGAAAIAGPALAQDPGLSTLLTDVAQPGPDGLTSEAIYVDAGAASRAGDLVTVTGGDDRVFLRFRQSTLRAGQATYDLSSQVATADDRVEFTDVDGNTIFASHLELDSDLQAGVAVDFATRFRNGSSLMAATAVRRSETVGELNYAMFTPCPICDEKGEFKQPSIAIQAEKVVQDRELRAVLYRNAVFRVGGVPVLYLPFFSHPDPTVDRASGFLVPIPGYDEGRGGSLEVPYYHVVSPSEDWVISPQINTNVAPLVNLQWRRRFADGSVVARSGYTYESNFGDFDRDGDGVAETNVKFGDRTNRSYLLAHGEFDPDGPWRWGFTAERVSDKTLFDRYDIRDPYQDNGLYYGDVRRLISQAYIERQTERSYLSVAAFAIQSLRVTRFDPVTPALNVFEDDGALPIAAPLIEGRWEPNGPVFGGRLRLRGSAVALNRDSYVGAPVLRPEVLPTSTVGLPGVDSQRVSMVMDWRRALISPMGIRWELFVDLRGDIYSVQDLPPVLGLDTNGFTRGRATAGVDLSYPLIKRISDTSDIVLEPMAQVSISNQQDIDPRIPIEDSQTLELDESSLFRTDRFPGYDLIEGGARLTFGGRATLRWDDVREVSLFVGRTLRDASEPGFQAPIPDLPSQLYDPTGLASDTSDWVVQGSFSPSDRARGWFHAALDSTGGIRRAETAVEGAWGRRNLASLSYIVDRSNPVQGPLNRNYEFIQASGQQFIVGNWGIAFNGIADLNENIITRSEVGLLFDDDCFRFEFGWRRNNTRVRPTGPSEGVYVRLNLATFGATGYEQGVRR